MATDTARPAGSRWRVGLRRCARTVVAAASAVVLVGTGFAWSQYGRLTGDVATSDVTTRATADGATDILLVGVDSRTDAQGRPLPEDVLAELHAGPNTANELTDTLILVHIPEDGRGAVAFSFPRDSYVRVPGHGKHKINSAFVRGKTAEEQELRAAGRGMSPREVETRAANAGRQLLVDTLQGLTGVSIDHYAEVNLLGFARITEALGGVPVCLNEAVHDPMSGARFDEGRQRLVGAEALAFVRQRHNLPRGDLDRVVRQQAFLAGLARAGLSRGLLTDPDRLGTVIDTVERYVVLDQDWDLMRFAGRLRNLSSDEIRFNTIPVLDAAYSTPDGTAVRIDPHQVRRAVRDGVEPSGPDEAPRLGPPGSVRLDGSAQPKRAAQPDGSAAPPAVTADELPCVN
ncbi:LCP family protein [Bounagaea algeriensis]